MRIARAPRWLVGSLVALGAAIAAPGAAAPALAQEACTAEAEPNDTAELGIALTGRVCITGTLPDGDGQDLWVWTVSQADATQRWTLALTGIPGTVTGVQLLPITSDPGSNPILVGLELIEVDSPPDATGPVSAPDLFIPAGRYVLGIAHTATLDGQPPASVDYRFTIEPGMPLPEGGDTEPNDDLAHASPVEGAFALSGILDTTSDYYAWTLTDADAAHGWAVTFQTDLGTTASVYLEATDGRLLANIVVGPDGRATLRDLKLSPGTYILQPSGPATPYVMTATVSDAQADPEPNNDAVTATPIEVGRITSGRIAGDPDVYRFTLDSTLAANLLDIRLLWRSDVTRSLCLSSSTGVSLGCTQGAAGIALRNLLLSPGEYLVTVNGEPALDNPYHLRIDSTSPPQPDFETEPNGTPDTATSFSAGITMRGRLDGYEYDVFRVHVEGVPQLWEVDATGRQLEGLVWLQADGTPLGTGEISTDHTSASLTDMFLVPGDHWFWVTGQGGDYALALTPIGAPDANSEREPNNDELHAEPMGLGSVRTGRLPRFTDTDVYRFSLEATEHIALTVDAPADTSVWWWLGRDGTGIASRRPSAIGASTRYDAVLPPGDYTIFLTTSTPGQGRYRLGLTREDPFALSDDQEPNDNAAQARPIPASGAVAGRADVDVDPDWYALGSLETSRSLEVRAEGTFYGIAISDGTTNYPLTRTTEADPYRSEPLPAGIPLYLHVDVGGDYTVSVGRDGVFGEPTPAPELPVDVAFSVETNQVAAYWSAGQRVDGALTLTSTGPDPVDLTLDTATSHYAWTASLDAPGVHLDPAQSVSVPVTIHTMADAWADIPVRITLRARDAAGRQRTAFVELTPGRETDPVHPEHAWTVPDALLGGLDAASQALGATLVVAFDADAESRLHDSVTPTGGGMDMRVPALPVTLTVDLAGDTPIPVAGTILNPLAGSGTFSGIPRRFELLLSSDGTTYSVALSGELSALPIDQSFSLPEPIMASYAQLRILSTWGDDPTRLVLGEWKVVASPGSAVGPSPLDIGAGVRGGHVTWMDPQSQDPTLAPELLTEDPRALQIFASVGTRLTWAIGFQDDRAAQVTELQWVDPAGSNPAGRMKRVDLAISTAGPSGPWVDAGKWTLHRAADGTVAPFTFAEPTWVRFLRFTGTPIPRDSFSMELPGTLRVIERGTDATYRSVVGEWGQYSFEGPREWLDPPSTAAPAGVPDDNDTPETADPLVGGQPAAGRVHIDDDVDWYSLSIPKGDNSVTFTVDGKPTVAVRLMLYDDTGAQIPMTFQRGDAPGTVEYGASVTGGAAYALMVEQPPFSAVFSFDNSGSMGPYLPFVTQAMRVYTGGVVPGEESVHLQAFEEPPLLPDWSDDQYQLQNAASNYVTRSGSSGVEKGVSDASGLLDGRQGARAILLVTDAETTAYGSNTEMWQKLATVRAQVFAVHVAGNGTPALDVHLMQDLAVATSGVYQYARSHAEMDRAFGRLATWLRRPAAYTLTATTSEKRLPPPLPGLLSVISASGPDGAPGPVAVGKDVAIELVLDTSGSMLKRFGSDRRIDVARDVFTALVGEDLPAGTPVALRIFGDRSAPCGTKLAVPFGPLEPQTITALVDRIRVVQEADTPIADALLRVPSDLAGSGGTRIVLLITDSEETWPHKDLCGRNPAAAIRQIRREGITSVNIVGLAVNDRKAVRMMKKWARSGNGTFFTAGDPDQLAYAIRTAVSAPFQVFDVTGELVASGIVNGAAVKLDPGTYRVVVLSDPTVTFEAVVVETSGSVTLQLK